MSQIEKMLADTIQRMEREFSERLSDLETQLKTSQSELDKAQRLLYRMFQDTQQDNAKTQAQVNGLTERLSSLNGRLKS